MVGLVACCRAKLAQPAPAADLYSSPLFRLPRQYVERYADRWFILSAQHGLVAPATMLAPYERSLNARPQAERRRWAAAVAAQLRRLQPAGHDLARAGRPRRTASVCCRTCRAAIQRPLAGLGSGQQLAWLQQHLEATRMMPTTVAAVLGPQGRLAGVIGPQYEARGPQLAMAERIRMAVQQRTPLVVEAGTGTGKSWAYLVGGLTAGARVVVSTSSKALQGHCSPRTCRCWRVRWPGSTTRWPRARPTTCVCKRSRAATGCSARTLGRPSWTPRP